MPNSYAISPGTVVGNQTVTGNLIVQGSTSTAGLTATGAAATGPLTVTGAAAISGDLQIESGLARTRRIREATNFLADGLNADPISGAQDDATVWSLYQQFRLLTGDWRIFRAKPGTTGKYVGPVLAEFLSASFGIHTGDVLEDTQQQSNITGGSMGTWGQIHLYAYLNATAQGATASTFRVRLGGTVMAALQWTTVLNAMIEVVIANQGLENSQKTSEEFRASNLSPSNNFTSTAVDTTVDQSLQVTLQNGATTDSNQLFYIQALGMFARAQIL